MTAAVITTTVASQEDATRLSTMLIDRRLAACVQEIAIGSRYRWEGEVVREPEILLLVKTDQDRTDDAVAAIESDHPYEVPEVLVLPVTAGAAAYLAWVAAETRPAA